MTFTPTPTSVPSDDWLTFTNLTYGFRFRYPPGGVIVDGNTETYARINLPFTPGTIWVRNIWKSWWLERMPVPAEIHWPRISYFETSETVVINGITFLKETGGDAGAGNLLSIDRLFYVQR